METSLQVNLFKKHLFAFILASIFIFLSTQSLKNIGILALGYTVIVPLSWKRNLVSKNLFLIFLEATLTFALIFTLAISNKIEIDKNIFSLIITFILFGLLITGFVYFRSKSKKGTET